MNIVSRYILRETAGPFILSLFIFTFVLLLDRIMKLVELMVTRGVGLTDIFLLFIYILPSFLTLTVPMAFLLSLLLAFGRLSSESEITAMKASGISFYRMMVPVALLSVIAYVATFFLITEALPWGNQAFRVKVFKIASGKASTGMKERVFNDDFDGIVLYADKVHKSGTMEGVLIYDQRETEGYTIIAREGDIISDPSDMTVFMRLRDGEIHHAAKGESYNRIGFSSYDLRLSFKAPARENVKLSKGDREMTVTELRERISDLKRMGGDPRPFEVELHKKFSIPFACIVFGLIGAPLGIQSKRSGKAHGFAISLCVFLFYYVSLIGGENLGDKGILPPFIAMWGPNILFTVMGISLVVRAANDSPGIVVSRMESGYDMVSRYLSGVMRRFQRER